MKKKQPSPKKHHKAHKKTEHAPKKTSHVLFGKHACYAAMSNPKRELSTLYVTKNAHESLPKDIAMLGVATRIVERDVLDAMAGEQAVHQGIVLECRPLAAHEISSAKNMTKLLLLDQVTDPHNIGAILRSAAAFGAQAIVQTKDHAPSETASMAKTASGALEIVPRICVTNLGQAMAQLKEWGFWCVGMDGHSDTMLHEVPEYDKVALVMGAEGKGLREGTAKHCDVLAKLPMARAVESLNVSNAAAVGLYELMRK